MPSFASIKDAQADLAIAALNCTVLLAPYNTTDAPDTLESPTDGSLDIPAEFVSLGHFEKKAGVALATDITAADIEAYGESDPIRTIISKRKTSINFSMYQNGKAQLELIWAANYDDVVPSAFGGVVLPAPSTPGNIFYRAILLGLDTRNSREVWPYWLMPKVQLSKVDNQSLNDDGVLEYKPTLTAFKDDLTQYSVAQGFAGPGWRDIIDLSGFAAALTTISATPTTKTISMAGTLTQQITVTGDNSINYTPDCSFSTSAPSTATVSASGLITGVAVGTATITAHKGLLTDTIAVTVTA